MINRIDKNSQDLQRLRRNMQRLSTGDIISSPTLDPDGGLESGVSGLGVNVDGDTLRITGNTISVEPSAFLGPDFANLGAQYYVATTDSSINGGIPSSFGQGLSVNIDPNGGLTTGGAGVGIAELTTKGDLLTWSTEVDRIGAGANGSVLTTDSTQSTGLKWNTVSEILDTALGSTRGSVLYRGSTGWMVLAPGTAGQKLTTQGAGADPVWS